MKLITFLHENVEKVGVLTADETAVAPLPFPDMNTLIESGDLSAAQAAESVPLSEVTLLAPIPHPRQDVICLGINYRSHAAEAEQYSDAFKKERPSPIYFSKRVRRAVDPEAPVDSHPDLVDDLDYEAELAVIVGKDALNVAESDAESYIFGYTILNDISARTLQRTHKQWYRGKSLDGFTPMGPWIVTADEIPFPPVLDIGTRVNGQLRQNSSTGCLIHGVGEILSEISAGMTLRAGSVIATGTPAGVAMGMAQPKYLRVGDVVECFIQGIGTLRNPVK